MHSWEFSKVENQVSKTLEQLSRLIKEKRENNNADQNCGYLVEYAIDALETMLLGKEASSRQIPTASSVNETENIAIRKFVPIKAENARKKKQLRIMSVIAHRTQSGLNSILPFDEAIHFSETDQGQLNETFFIDLTAGSILKKRAKLAELKSLFTDKATKSNSVLIGHIGLVRIGKSQESHVIAFCATRENIYYIDGQFYDGINHVGEPVFQDLSTKFAFTTQYDSLPQGDVADDCFYLIHRLIPYSVMLEKSMKKESENSSNIVTKRKLASIKKERATENGTKEKQNKKIKREEDLEKNQSYLFDEQALQVKPEAIEEATVVEERAEYEVFDEAQVIIERPSFEKINESIIQMNRLARTKSLESLAIDECRRILSTIDSLKLSTESESLKKRLEAREYHCYYQILQCQKRAGFLSLGMPQVRDELNTLDKQLLAIINTCQIGIPCSERDTYTISMANSARNAIRLFHRYEVTNELSMTRSSLLYAATLIKYIKDNKIEELKKYFKPSRYNATVSDHIEQAIELLNEANHYLQETNDFGNANHCNDLIAELKNLLKDFLPEKTTFFGDHTKREGTAVQNNTRDKGKEKVTHMPLLI